MKPVNKRRADTPRSNAWRALAILTVLATGACSDSDEPSSTPSSGQDASTDSSGDSAPASGGGGSGGQGMSDDAGEDSGSATGCELSADGTCSPAPDPAVGECNGCYAVLGQRYDAQRGCLADGSQKTVACSTICMAGEAFDCYVRAAGQEDEVILSPSSYFDADKLEDETGFVPCDGQLRGEVLGAALCDTR